MISRRTFLYGASLPAIAASGADSRSQLIDELRKQKRRTWLPFDYRSTEVPKIPASSRPRLAGDPELWKLRARTIRESIWRALPQKPYEAPKPNPEGNGGAPGYVLLDLTAAWLATGAEFYAETAIRTLRRVSEYKYWGGINGKPKDTDLHAGALLFGGGFAFDTFRDRIPEADRRVIVEQFARHAELMFRHHNERDHLPWEQNHTYIDLGGLWCTAAALAGEAPEAESWMRLGARAIKTAMYLLNSPDGSFYEGTHYWNFGFAQHLLPTLELYRNWTGEDPFGGSQFLRNVKLYVMHTLLPGGKNDINLGDAAAGPISEASMGKARYAMFKCASEYGDPECQFLAGYFTEANRLQTATDPWTLTFWDPSIEPRDPRPSWNTVHHFDDLGLVTARSSWRDDATHLTLRCGPAIGHRSAGILLSGEIPKWAPSTGHTHPDLNSILLYDAGEHLLVETGYTWTKLVREHSTVAVDGGGQVGDNVRWPDYGPYDRHGRMAAFLGLSNEYCYLRGEAAGGYEAKLKLDRFDRNAVLMFAPGQSYLLLHDRLESSVEHQYEWLLIAISQARETAPGVYRISSGSRALTVRLIEPGDLKFHQEPAIALGRGDQGGSQEQRGQRLSFSSSRRKSLEVTALLQLHNAAEAAPAVQSQSGALRISGAGWEDLVTVGGKSGPLSGDGHHATVRQQSGRVTRWAVQDATSLTMDSQTIFSSPSRVSAAGCAHTVVFEAAAASEVAFRSETRPVGCRLDGKAIRYAFDASKRLTRLEIPAGRHTVELS
jgi:hypothetical protein